MINIKTALLALEAEIGARIERPNALATLTLPELATLGSFLSSREKPPATAEVTPPATAETTPPAK
jgi:hypothetical protein